MVNADGKNIGEKKKNEIRVYGLCLQTEHVSKSRTPPSFASNSITILIPLPSFYRFVLLCLITEVLQEAPVNALGFLPKVCVESPQNADPCWSTTQETHNTHKNQAAQEEQTINMKDPNHWLCFTQTLEGNNLPMGRDWNYILKVHENPNPVFLWFPLLGRKVPSYLITINLTDPQIIQTVDTRNVNLSLWNEQSLMH